MPTPMTLISPQSPSLEKKVQPVISLIKKVQPSVSLILGNQPINTIAPVITGIAQRGETLSSTTGTWTGVGTITFAYQWQRDNVNISGATSSTYVLVAADDNTSITCVVSATDSEGTGTATSNAISPILGVPYNLVAPVASGTGQVGQILSTTNGSWQGIATITFTYQWRRDASDISGATSSTYTLVADDYATDIDCVVTATNSLGSANQDSNDIANIAGSVPVISGVPTISGTAKVGETLTATAASVTGTPTPTNTFQWQRSDDGSTGWANISGATNSTYTAVSADESKYLRVLQTSTNVIGSDTANSASTTQVSAAFDYLLDTYSGAAVAYSLRLLRSGYSGSAIRVRRSDDNEEQDISFRNNELDTSSLETFCGSSDGFVTTWYDQSGNGYNITESTASKQQQIVAAGTTITDGDKPTITISQSTFNGFTISIPSSSRQDFFQVHKTNDDRFILLKDSASGTRYAYATIDGNTSTGLHGNYGTPSLYVNGSAQAPENRDDLHTLLCTNSQVLMSSIGGDSSAWTGNVIWGYYSSANTYNGNLQELIFYNSDQSSNRSGIETNINVFYSIYE